MRIWFYQLSDNKMKRKLILIVIGLILVFVPESNAQNLRFGLLGGYDIVTIHQIPLDTQLNEQPYDPIMSYNINGFISLKNKGLWGISFEPGLMQKGGLLYKSRAELKYLQMPLSVDVYILHRLYFSFGPELAYMISAKAINPNSVQDISGIINKKFEASGSIGINYMIGKRIGIGLKYNHGLTYIYKSPQYGDNWEILHWLHYFNEYFQVRVSFRILELTNTN
jgi:hypothetical protein